MSGYQSLAHRYREVAVRTANPLQLIIMLYDAAICTIQEARNHIEQKNIGGRSRSINKCIAIISELQASLNLKIGGEIAGSLDRLYDYMKRRLFAANVQQSTEPLVEIETLLENLRSAWRDIAGPAQEGEALADTPVLPDRIMTGASTPATAMQFKSFNVSI